MRDIINRTWQEIEKRFKTDRGYVGLWSGDNSLYCPQVNGLVNLCLCESGLPEKARENSRTFLDSPSFDMEEGLFYREVDRDGKVVSPYFNTCKNAVFALGLALSGLTSKAENILRIMKESPLYFKDQGLYVREYNPDTGEINPLLITQSNLWVALAYSTIGQDDESRKILRSLENSRYDKDQRLFNSQDCRDLNYQERFFLDDQALAILAYLKLGEKEKARNLLDESLRSPLYDRPSGLFNSSFLNLEVDQTKSTYKNSLMARALRELGYFSHLERLKEGLVRELYDFNENLFNQTTNDETKVPDNSALALIVLGDYSFSKCFL